MLKAVFSPYLYQKNHKTLENKTNYYIMLYYLGEKKMAVKKSVKKKTEAFSQQEMSDYLISTVREVIEVSRKPVPVLDKAGNPTGVVEYQSATVLKACELMAKLMGSIKETDTKGVSVQIVSYRDVSETEEGSSSLS